MEPLDGSMRVEVVAHDPGWKDAFDVEAAQIVRMLGDRVIAVHHIGSTAIPGIFAKPIIDILLEVEDIEWLGRESPKLEAIGYEAKGEFGIAGRRYFRKDDGSGVRTHQVHAFQAGDVHVVRHMAFRDYMIAHPEAARAYGALKRRLANEHPDDIDAYMDGKDSFIKEQERHALAWRRSRLAAILTVREATAEDEPAIEEVNRLATARLREVYRPTRVAFERRAEVASHLQRSVAILEGRVMGVVQHYVADGALHLLGLGVHPTAHRRGVARALIEHLDTTARRGGCSTLVLHTIRQTGNVAVFERLGFSVKSERVTDLFTSDRFAALSEVVMTRAVAETSHISPDVLFQ